MTYSQERIDAYEALEEAINRVRKAHGADDDMLTGFIVLTSAVEFKEPDPDNPEHDDLDVTPYNGWYSRRGQDPTLSFGILNEALRHYNMTNMRYATGD